MSDAAVWTAVLTGIIIVAGAMIERRLLEIRDELRKLNKKGD